MLITNNPKNKTIIFEDEKMGRMTFIRVGRYSISINIGDIINLSRDIIDQLLTFDINLEYDDLFQIVEYQDDIDEEFIFIRKIHISIN
ncbi:hypothetical protein VN24_02910 [Paenibacillus beijingensis]|uniref:Uncharacterized protein n=1 Tax=Paenibacillus beijingensis TaxID=1126833 RepID=A0A0D5NFT8_9BACL|nr:hypothetical protein VN24_02910 [Paenibacillus beijingensis]